MVDIPLSGPARLDGQIAFVTGAAGGIGRATALALAAAGARVFATDITETADFGGAQGISYSRYDVTSLADTDAVIGGVLKEAGRIDMLILCAGSISHKPLTESTNDEWESILQVNLYGVLNPVRKVFPVMAEQGYGKMVAVGSIAAKIGGVAAGPSYVAAKSAVHGLFKWVAKAGAAKGVYASVVAPGPVETPMWEKVTLRAPPSAHKSVPLGRYGQPEDIAQSIVFLASPMSNWITGTVLDINGGMLMD